MKLVANGLRFPEGPVAMADGSVLVVEIERETLSRVAPDGTIEVVAKVPGGPNGAALGPDGRVYICNNGGFGWHYEPGTMRPHGIPDTYRTGSIDVVDLKTGRGERLYESCYGNRLNGPNDIVFDGHGGFWFTDLGKRRARDMDRGFVYWAKADGSEIREVICAMQTPNGIGLSPDGKTLYVAETDTARLWAFEVTGPGEIRRAPWPSPHGGRIVAGLPGYHRFDSLAVAGSGAICVAGVDACAIFEFAPDGTLRSRHAVPDMMVTNLAFGGPELRTAFVTLSHSGRLLALDWPEPGLRLHHQD